MAGFMGDKQLG
jgi:transposase, IS5 family